MIALIVSLLAILTYLQITNLQRILERELERRIELKEDILKQRGKTLSDTLARQAENDIAAFNFSNLNERINNAVREDDELIYIVLMDSNRIAYIHTLTPSLQQETLERKEDIYAVSLPAMPNMYKFDRNGVSIMEFIVPIQISAEPWGVLRLGFSIEHLNQEIEESRKEIISQNRVMIRRSTVTLLIFVAIGAAIVIYGSTKFSTPLISLTESARRLSLGNFEAAANIAIDSNDEVGVLARTFVKMSKDLKVSYDKLEDYSRTLEQKVEARTKELKGANDQLHGEIKGHKRTQEELQQKSRIVQLLEEVVTAANETSSFDRIAKIAIDRVCLYTGWPVGHVYVPADDGSGDLSPTSIWHLDDPEKFESFRVVTEHTRFASGIGLPGRVLAGKKPAWIIDVTKDPNFPRAKQVAEIGVRAGFAFPVLSGTEVGAVMEFFSSKAVEPDETLLEILYNIGTNLGRVIERQRAAEKIVKANMELKETMENLRQAQGQLVESEKMASLGGLVAGIAHEINTPVGIGVTAASLLEDKTRLFLTLYQQGQMKRSDLEKFLDISTQSSQMILSNLNRASELIHSFKQVAVDRSSEEKRIFSITEYLDEILLSLRPKLKKTAHKITIDCPADLKPNSYPGAFAQIITNLVLNSLIHAYDKEEQGQLTLEIKTVGDELHLRYSDDGRGIKKEHLGQIFDPFFTTKRGQGGSGLGMHLVYNLVTQKLRGSIKCDSVPGAGTTFYIRIPLTLRD